MGNERSQADEWGLVGRAEELGLIDDLRARRVGVLLSGAAGTGKSRLAREAAGRAGTDGWHVIRVAATSAAGSIPYGALTGLLPPISDVRWLDVLGVIRDLHRTHKQVVMLVDDINHLDQLSMAIVHRTLVEDLAFVIATVRSGDDGNPDVVALWKDLGVTRLDVRELSRTETATMIGHGLGGEVDGVTARDIWSVTRGVPLYIRELVSAATSSGALSDDSGIWMSTRPLPTPGSLSGMILQRIGSMSQEAMRAARFLAVAGTLRLEDLRELVSDRAVEEAERAGAATVAPGQPPTVSLAHPMHGEVMSAEMTGTERLAAITELVEALERRSEITTAELIAMASWKLDLGVVDPALFDRAAHAAHDLGDFPLAERLATEASDQGHVEASMLLAQIRHERGDHAGADALNRSLAADVESGPLANRLAVQRSVNLFFGLGDGEGALAALDAQVGVELELNRAWILINMGRISEADAITRAVEDRSDPLVWSVTRAWVDALGPDPERALEAVECARQLRPATALPSRFRDFPDIPATLALIAMGELSEAESVATQGLTDSIDRHPMFVRAWWHLLLGTIALDRGRVDSAAQSFERGTALQRRMNQPGLQAWYQFGTELARSQSVRGPVEPRDHPYAAPRPERLFDGFLTEASAWKLSRADPDSAISTLTGEAAALRSEGLDWMARRLELAAHRIGGKVCEPGPEHLRRRVEVALVAANTSETTGSLTDAAEAAEAAGMQLVAAEAWGRLSVAFRRDGDQRGATMALRAHRHARDQCESALTGRLVVEDAIDPLSERERQVLTLAASGTPSKQIASQLDVSVRTVNNQIQRAFVKLGVSSRAEAARALGITKELDA